MNRELAQKIADAVLYEGYMLYPYRPSAIKNRQRWCFGILYPPAYHEVSAGTERSYMHSECLLQIVGEAILNVQLRFLHLLTRQVAETLGDDDPINSWDEGVERSVEFEMPLVYGTPRRVEFSFPGSYQTESSRDASGQVVGSISRTQHELTGFISVQSETLRQDLLKLSIDVANSTLSLSGTLERNAALLRSLVSAHTLLTATGARFVSLLDPPEDCREAANACSNIGNFPVLVGAQGERDMLLCSPILLYDYPQVAPESAGDFYDATEMDEMLTLRVSTLTEQEKDEIRSADDHVRNLLQRTEASAREHLMRTHGTIRSLRPASEKS
jgi:hypothetical protein